MFWLNEYFLAFGRVVATKVEGAAKAVLENIEALDGDTSTGEPQYGPLGRYGRPMPPVSAEDATGLSPEGEAETLGLRLGDRIHQIGAYRDLRLNAQVNPAEGAIGDAHYGGGFIEQSWNADQDGTNITLYALRKTTAGVADKASVIALDSAAATASIAIVHETGQSVTMNQGGDVLVSSADGTAFLQVKNGEIIISGTSVSVTGGVNLGDKDPSATQFVALANLVKAEIEGIVTTIQGWTPVANDGGAALKTAFSAYTVGSVAATVAKAK